MGRRKERKMNWYDAMEEAYKKGYDQGLKDAQKNVRHGHWVVHCAVGGRKARTETWAECSYCHVTGSPVWKVCPVCETVMDMDVEPEPSCNRCANDGMDVPQCDECPGSGFKWFREKM
jgi:hypothetical protein